MMIEHKFALAITRHINTDDKQVNFEIKSVNENLSEFEVVVLVEEWVKQVKANLVDKTVGKLQFIQGPPKYDKYEG